MKQVSVADRYDRLLRVALPIVVLTIGLLIWEAVVQIKNIPPYVLPGPGLILSTLIDRAMNTSPAPEARPAGGR